MTRRLELAVSLLGLILSACSDSADPGKGSGGAGGAPAQFDSGVELRVPVADAGRTYVKLSPPSIVVPDDPATSADWDLAFEHFEVFTNGGVSGPGQGAAFGPLDAAVFARGEIPEVPFLAPDKTGGAFLDWYAYESETHALFSRYHVYGVRDGDQLWKVQVLTYYGLRDGAAVSALYALRYAAIDPGHAGTTRDETDLDGSAGGVAAPSTAPSECIDLGSGVRTMLTPDAARTSNAWHLCFRRASIMVNGEAGGPRGIGAVDPAAGQTATETFAAIKEKTAETERPSFDAVSVTAFEQKTFRGDRTISAFSDLWTDGAKGASAPLLAAWLVRDALGRQQFLLGFTAFENATPKSPGTVVMRIKPAGGR